MDSIAQDIVDGVLGSSKPQGSLARRVHAVRESIVNRRLSDLPATRLRAMETRLDEQSEHIVETLEGLEARGEQAIADSDWRRFDIIRRESIEAARDFDELQRLKKRIADARYERQLNDALAERLGSHTRRRVYDVFLMALIVAVVAMLLYELLYAPPPPVRRTLDLIDIGCCVIFLGDFAWRHRLAESKGWFWRRYWIDFITSIPLPSAHTLRLGRTVRLIRLLRMLRLVRLIRIFRVVLFFWRGMDKLAAAFDVHLMRRSINILTAILLVGGVGIWILEDNPSLEDLTGFGEWLWWSFTTVVTGGFGDLHNPATIAGRLLTVLLVIAGMVVVGIFTATLTSLLVRESDASGAILALEDRILEELDEIRARLEGGSTGPEDQAPPPG